LRCRINRAALAGFVIIVAWLAMIGFVTIIMWGLQ